MKKPIAICIIGLSGSGKTSTVKRLSQELGFAFFSVGGYQLEIARRFGFNDAIDYEKAVGLKKGYYDLFPKMVKRIKELALQKGGVVLEGVYTPAFLDKISAAFGHGNVHLFNLASTRHARVRKMLMRSEKDLRWAKNELRRRDRAKFAVGVNEILKRSRPFTIRITGNLDNTVARIRNRLK